VNRERDGSETHDRQQHGLDERGVVSGDGVVRDRESPGRETGHGVVERLPERLPRRQLGAVIRHRDGDEHGENRQSGVQHENLPDGPDRRDDARVNLLLAGLALIERVAPTSGTSEDCGREDDDTDATDPLDERAPPLKRPRERRFVDRHRQSRSGPPAHALEEGVERVAEVDQTRPRLDAQNRDRLVGTRRGRLDVRRHDFRWRQVRSQQKGDGTEQRDAEPPGGGDYHPVFHPRVGSVLEEVTRPESDTGGETGREEERQRGIPLAEDEGDDDRDGHQSGFHGEQGPYVSRDDGEVRRNLADRSISGHVRPRPGGLRGPRSDRTRRSLPALRPVRSRRLRRHRFRFQCPHGA